MTHVATLSMCSEYWMDSMDLLQKKVQAMPVTAAGQLQMPQMQLCLGMVNMAVWQLSAWSQSTRDKASQRAKEMIPLASLAHHRMYCWKACVTDQSVKLISQALTFRARCQRCQNTVMMQQAENGVMVLLGVNWMPCAARYCCDRRHINWFAGLPFGVVAFWDDQETFSCIEFACCACLLISACPDLHVWTVFSMIFMQVNGAPLQGANGTQLQGDNISCHGCLACVRLEKNLYNTIFVSLLDTSWYILFKQIGRNSSTIWWWIRHDDGARDSAEESVCARLEDCKQF